MSEFKSMTLRLSWHIEAALRELAVLTNKSKASYVREAVREKALRDIREQTGKDMSVWEYLQEVLTEEELQRLWRG